MRNQKAEDANRRGSVLFGQGKFDQAVQAFDEAIRIDDRYHVYFINRAFANASRATFDKALQDAERAIGLEPNAADAYNARGWAHSSMGNLDCAILDFDTAIRLHPLHAGAHTNRARVHAALKNYDRAIADYEKALSIDKNLVEAWNDLGTLYVSLGNLEKALKNLTSAVQIQPGYWIAVGNRGAVYAKLGDHYAAVRDFDRAISLNNKSHDFYYGRAESYVCLSKWEEALVDICSAMRLQPDNPNMRLTAFYIYIALDNDDHARDELAHAARSSDPKVQARCALRYHLLGQSETAETALDQLVRNHPEDTDILESRGQLHFWRDELDQAMDDLNAAIKLEATPNRLCLRARVLLDKGMLDTAWSDCDQAIALDPKCSDAYAVRARILLERDQFEDCIQACNQSLAGKFPHAESFTIRAHAHSQMGNDDQALADFRRASDYRGKGYLSLKRGEHFEKLKQYQTALLDYKDAERLFRKRGHLAEAAKATSAIDRLISAGLITVDSSVASQTPRSTAPSSTTLQPDNKDVIATISERLKDEPDWTEGYLERGLAFLELGQIELAVRDFGSALLLEPHHKEALMHRARALLTLGRSSAAIEDCDLVINLDHNSAPAFFSRGIAQRALGKRQLATSDLRKAAELYALSGNDSDHRKSLEAIEDHE